MATNYIKVRPYVAEQMGVGGSRAKFPDGNVCLWEKDLALIDRGWPRRREEVVARVGGVLLDPYQARDEHYREPEECVPLPEPTDPAWREPEGWGEEEEGSIPAPDASGAGNGEEEHEEEGGES